MVVIEYWTGPHRVGLRWWDAEGNARGGIDIEDGDGCDCRDEHVADALVSDKLTVYATPSGERSFRGHVHPDMFAIGWARLAELEVTPAAH